MIRKIWREVRSIMYIRCRFTGSGLMWFWLAKIIRGSSQQVKTSRGVERGSRAIKWFIVDQPVSDVLFSQVKLMNAMIRLWARAVGQRVLEGASQVVGTSIIVGIKIFSIAEG